MTVVQPIEIPKSTLSYCEGSFRDPEGRVFEYMGRIFRTTEKTALNRMRGLLKANFFQELIQEGLIIPTDILSTSSLGLSSEQFGIEILEHEKITLITLPYEWSFDMLKEAALNHLKILKCGLENGYILKDGTAFNMMYRNGKMCFIDILSFDNYHEGQPWDGYGQFCQEFLVPLMLSTYKNIEFQPWWRGTSKGIPIANFAKLLNFTDYFKPGIFKHIILQHLLSQSFSHKKPALESTLKNKLSKQVLMNLINNLENIIQKLKYFNKRTPWINYVKDNSYLISEQNIKEAFVENGIKQITPKCIVDLGANTGYYSKLAAKECKNVISIDLDPACINDLFFNVKKENLGNKIIPLISDLINPTPPQGWALQERTALFDRLQCDFFLALALVHHLCIGSNVPLDYFVKMLKNIANAGIVEWVDRKDKMVQFMLRNRKDVFQNYTWENFKSILEQHFELLNVIDIQEGTRKICLLGKIN